MMATAAPTFDDDEFARLLRQGNQPLAGERCDNEPFTPSIWEDSQEGSPLDHSEHMEESLACDMCCSCRRQRAELWHCPSPAVRHAATNGGRKPPSLTVCRESRTRKLTQVACQDRSRARPYQKEHAFSHRSLGRMSSDVSRSLRRRQPRLSRPHYKRIRQLSQAFGRHRCFRSQRRGS